MDLISIQQNFSLHNHPWVVGGDLNQILHHTEHSSPTVNYLSTGMIELRDCLLQTGLFDLRYYGLTNTWSNKRPEEPIAEKLDRLLVNQTWISTYPNSSAFFLPPAFSDHSPCILDLSIPLPIAGTKPFKFYNYLSKHPKFLSLVADYWIQAGGIASNLGDLSWKLKNLRGVLKELNRANFSNIQVRVSIANRLLITVQEQALQNPTHDLFLKEKEIHDKWLFLRSIEEAYFRQKSRITWLQEGDLNTSYFHRIWKVRTAINSIRSFLLPSGLLLIDPVAMGELVVNHFKGILAPTILPASISTPQWFISLSSFACSPDQRLALDSVPSLEDLSKAILKLNPNKAPGPDGLTSGFFKSAWSIVGEDVVSSLATFFRTGFLPTSVNATILTLVPKHPGASAITDYRPISCCTTLYKAISNILVSKLKQILPKLILPNQTHSSKDGCWLKIRFWPLSLLTVIKRTKDLPV